MHNGPGGVNAPFIFPITFTGDEAKGSQAFSTEEGSTVTLANLQRGLWYVNIHTTANPGGEIRGQIMKPAETLYVAALAAPIGIVSTGTGGAGLILSRGQMARPPA